MDYVTWVERVFAAAMAQDDGAMGYTSSFAIAKALSFAIAAPPAEVAT